VCRATQALHLRSAPKRVVSSQSLRRRRPPRPKSAHSYVANDELAAVYARASEQMKIAIDLALLTAQRKATCRADARERHGRWASVHQGKSGSGVGWSEDLAPSSPGEGAPAAAADRFVLRTPPSMGRNSRHWVSGQLAAADAHGCAGLGSRFRFHDPRSNPRRIRGTWTKPQLG